MGTLPAIIALLLCGQGSQGISERIGKLRQMDDAARAKETMDLAIRIRRLSSSQEKVGLASSLANLATEGDFGRDTLQAVTETLCRALHESPADAKAYPYTQLAQLLRYEGMKLVYVDPAAKAAIADLDALDKKRASLDFTLTDLNGQSWTLSALKGKVVLVNFWATWCPPCRKEMPDLEFLANKFKDKGLVILAISDETMDKVQPFISTNKYTYHFLLDPGRKVNTDYGIQGIPKSFLYDRSGKLAGQTIDMRTRSQFMALLAKAGLK